MSLDPKNDDSGYLLGRLFATYEYAQTQALGGKVNATIRDQYYGTASATPRAVFPLLQRKATHHLSRLRKDSPGSAKFLDSKIGEIFELAEPESLFVPTLSAQRQALFAIGSGRWVGKGYLLGTQNQLRYLPEHWTDFPFAVWAEEWGLVACLLMLVFYLLFLLWCLNLANEARDRFARNLTIGCASLFFWHTAINIAMVSGIAPVVGVTPLGLARPPVQHLLYRHGRERGFGQSVALLCPHYLGDSGGCGIWRHRNGVCATWFCKHTRGERAKAPKIVEGTGRVGQGPDRDEVDAGAAYRSRSRRRNSS